jgi:tetratricopeptide (TPR) repeat protein
MAKKPKANARPATPRPTTPAAPAPEARAATPVPAATTWQEPPLDLGWTFPLPVPQFRVWAALLMALAFVLNANTLFHLYTVDDNMVINSNTHTLKGFGGIDDLLFKDTQHGYVAYLHGFEKETNDSTVTYYRPLSLVTFALEIGLFGYKKSLTSTDPEDTKDNRTGLFSDGSYTVYISHAVNVLLYVYTVFLLFKILYQYCFRANPAIAVFATLVFTVHPLHTEVVANIKGRDELLTLVFLLLTQLQAFKYFLEPPARQTRHLVLTLVFYALAYLSKENSITYLAVFPLTLYFFLPPSPDKLKRLRTFLIPLVLLTVGYLVWRAQFTTLALARDQDNILYNRFARSGFAEKYATCFYILWFYVSLLFYPHPLSWDYNYRAFDFYSFADPIVWFSIVLHGGLFVWALLNLKSKNVLAYGLMYYFITISIVSNLIIDIGGFVGERFLYQPSVGFAVVVGVVVVRLAGWLQQRSSRALGLATCWGLMLVSSAALAAKTVDRNADWHDNKRLFCRDARYYPTSAKCLMACANTIMKEAEDTKKKDPEQGREIFRQALEQFVQAVRIMPHFDSYLNMGEIYFNLDSARQAAEVWHEAYKINPLHPKMHEYYRMMPLMTRDYGARSLQRQKPDSALYFFDIHVRYYRSKNDTIWFEMGKIHADRKDFKQASFCFRQAAEAKPNNPMYWHAAGGTAYMAQDYSQAEFAFTRCLQLDPNFADAARGLAAAQAQLKAAPR